MVKWNKLRKILCKPNSAESNFPVQKIFKNKINN